MKSKRLTCILFLLVSPFLSPAQHAATILLEGTVGKASVVMEITLNGSEVYGNYYYKRFKKNIPLEGRYTSKNEIELTYQHWSTKETFTLLDIGSSSLLYSGTWENTVEDETGTVQSKSLPVKLQPFDISKITPHNSFVKRSRISEYDYSRLAHVVLKQDSIQKINAAFSITWFHDTISDFRSFRICKNTAAKGIDSINLFLEDLQFSELLSFLDCPEYGYTSDISGVYINGHVLSFSVFNSYDCGGAHPDFGATGYTFNMETGKQFELTDFLFFGKTEADYKKEDSYKFTTEFMKPRIAELLTKLYPNEMKKPTDEDEICDYSDPDVWSTSTWFLTEKGLFIYSYFYRAARCCDGAEFSTIPYKTLLKYKNPKAVIPMQY